jgi:DNA repair photolyase
MTDPPQQVLLEESQADIISPARGFMEGFDLTMQLQVGCPGGCLFCYVPAGWNLTPSEVKGPQGRTWGFVVRNKANALQKFRRHLEADTLVDKTLYWSGVTDPYAAQPSLTRAIWQTLCEAPARLRPRRIVVQTRFRPDRDAALMAEFCRTTSPSDQGPPVVISYSIGTDRNDLIRAWERATPSFDKRMYTIKALCDAGLFVVATLSPLGLWHDLPGTLRQLKAWGVAYLTVLCFKVKTTQDKSASTPPHFLNYLREEYPEVLDLDWQAARLAEMRTIYGVERVLTGQKGFKSLACPHKIVGT